MKIQKTVILTLCIMFLVGLNTVNSQSAKYYDVFLEPDTLKFGTYKDFEAYDLGHLVLYKRAGRSNKIQIMDKSTDIELFSFENSLLKTHLKKPKFFKTYDIDNAPTIVMLDVSEIYSHGVHVFLIEDSQVFHSGYLDYAADNFNFSSIALYSHFEQIGDKLILSFDEVDLIDHVSEELVNGAYLKFEILKDNIRRYIN